LLRLVNGDRVHWLSEKGEGEERGIYLLTTVAPEKELFHEIFPEEKWGKNMQYRRSLRKRWGKKGEKEEILKKRTTLKRMTR